MGKFKELALEIKEIKRDQQRRQLRVQYPSIASFIDECFARREEGKVYELILSFQREGEECKKQLH